MFSVALPVFVRVTFSGELFPTFTFPNAKDDALMLSCACAATPLPLSPTTNGEPGAVLVIETLPLALPAAVGANVAVNVAVAPGASACGDRVLMLKPVPLALAALMDKLAVPEFVNVTFTEALLPVTMLPKLMLAGFAVSVAWVPVPLNTITSDEFVAVDAIVIVPEAAPAPLGANWAVSVAVPPAAICWPGVIPLALNPVPAATALLIVIGALPLFVSVIVCVLLLPATTLPKLKLPGFALSVLFAATALPVSETACGEFGPLSEN